jgi:uncharacterized repeat protein (TIGR03803 family)
LVSFDGTDGASPWAGLVQGTTGDLYGVAELGGANGGGAFFRITPSGALTTFYSFCAVTNPACTEGSAPVAGLIQGTNGDFYGTTEAGGSSFATYDLGGTVFKITPSGALTTLYSFCSDSNCTDGATPFAGLVQATNGEFYGTTQSGGANCFPEDGCGTVFRITPSGTLTTLYSFCAQSGCTDGSYPSAGLVQATNGNLYGTTAGGGANGYGTVFEITPSGTLTTLYSFCSQDGCTDGDTAEGGLVQATNGKFYGTTAGGAYGYGTVFNITPSGTLTTLYSSCEKSQCTDGAAPGAGLVQATDGNFYGTTYYGGGANYGGTIFKITGSGTLTTLYSFCALSGCTDGEYPLAALVQDASGVLYGTTYQGGSSGACFNGCGTVFSLSVGLGPSVKTLPTSGKVGSAVKILGTGLTGATKVTFNGTAAVFTVVSSSEITTTVPAGATTGKVAVITPSRTLSSNVAFGVP